MKKMMSAFVALFVLVFGVHAQTYSLSNQFRSALGLNQVGTMQSSATMYANRYNLQKALQLFGAVAGYGAQLNMTK